MILAGMIKKYDKKSGITYSLGAFPTFEALQHRPDIVEAVIISTKTKPDIRDRLCEICGRHSIPVWENDRLMEKVRRKEKNLVAGVLQKYEDSLDERADHVVLVNPGDMGNLGTIMRTCVGFGIENLALIEPAADFFDPKVIRASMGAIFSLHVKSYASFEQYRSENDHHRDFYPFMLKGAQTLAGLSRNGKNPCSLIFGNEASGLEDEFQNFGQSIVIEHTGRIDSLNLSMAVGIALYEFAKR